MKDPIIYDTKAFPAQLFGKEIKREVRLIVSPETTGDGRIRIVTATVPPHGVADGHIHPDADEYIHFDIAGKVRLDGEEYDVPAGGIVHAVSGVRHECVNCSDSETLHLLCFFVPAFEPYGAYPELIRKTNDYLDTL